MAGQQQQQQQQHQHQQQQQQQQQQQAPGQSNVDEVKLRPLDLNCVTQLVVDSFRCKRDTALPLATLLLKKTAGVI